MKLNKISASLTETELVTIIKEAVFEKTGLKVSTVSFDIVQCSIGYGVNESTTYVFDGATVHFDKDQDIQKG
jgi:hypothetical protein